MQRTLDTHGRLAAIKALAKITDNVCVSFSGGKDSLAVLSLCKRFIPKVSAVFFYKLPNLSFEQEYLARVSRQLDVEIQQYPGPGLLELLRNGTYGADTVRGTADINGPDWWRVKARGSKMLNAFMRRATGATYTAVGIKKYDTLVRYHTIYKQFGYMNQRDQIAYPVIDWKDSEVWAYIRLQRLPVNPIYAKTGRSFGTLTTPSSLRAIRELFPQDFERIKAFYPHVEVVIVRGDELENVKANRRIELAAIRKAARSVEAPSIQDGALESEGHQEGTIQPTGDLASG